MCDDSSARRCLCMRRMSVCGTRCTRVGENRTWLSNYNCPWRVEVPTLSGDYILSEDIHGKTFRIKGDTNIDLNGHSIDGDDEEEIGFTVDEGKTLAFINSGEDAYIRDYEENGVVLDDESKLACLKAGMPVRQRDHQRLRGRCCPDGWRQIHC